MAATYIRKETNMAHLVINESPTKASTIKSSRGKGYKVVASKGHVRDLPKSTLGVDIENGFEPKYINIRGKGALITELRKEAKAADIVYLATDPDREGEAISWHLMTVLGLTPDKVKRVTFNELTKPVIREAIKNPREIDMNLVNSQQARRILDRIVGYKLSPILWRKIKSGLSAGRVQSVATRIIVERENEIRSFVPTEYWSLDVLLETEDKKTFKAAFYGNADGKIEVGNADKAKEIHDAVVDAPFSVASVKKSKRTKNPAPPFTTSTLQQEANRRLGFYSEKTMRVAQELYEGISLGSLGTQGLITYMRTDSLRISEIAQAAAREYIEEKFGREYYPKTARVYKTKKGAQDAHEAIRPSDMKLEPDTIKQYLSADQYKLYKLIWDRFVSSQMESAVLDTVSADIESAGYIFRASGYTVKFPGYMALYEEKTDDENDEEKESGLPEMKKGDALTLSKIDPAQHFTQPPARFNEATLIKVLEEKGIGRPSTYTPTITTIIARGYVEREGRALVPTSLGEVTTKLMCDHFEDIVDYSFTARMEDSLDEVESGDRDMGSILSSFYGKFSTDLSKAESEIEKGSYKIAAKETDIICEKCGSRMVVKNGRFGKFAACPNYPECKNTKPLDADGNAAKPEAEPAQPEEIKYAPDDVKCENCGGRMVIKKGRYGTFYACENYPECKTTKAITKDTNVKCPLCGSKIVIKHGRKRSVFYSCEAYPKCNFSTWDVPMEEPCPKCGGLLLKKKGKDNVFCFNEKCGYKK